jgi:transcriptional regulator of acetoin/glycerol metabolism
MSGICLGCDTLKHKVRILTHENSRLRAQIGCVRRLVSEESTPNSQPLSLVEVERNTVLSALDRAMGNRNKAAVLLGVARSTLFQMLKRHGITDARSR